MRLGEYLEKARLEKGWSLRELARRSGVNYMAINHIETGDTGNPGLGTVLDIAKALGLHPMSIISAFQGKDPDTLPESDPDADLVSAIEEVLSRRKQRQ